MGCHPSGMVCRSYRLSRQQRRTGRPIVHPPKFVFGPPTFVGGNHSRGMLMSYPKWLYHSTQEARIAPDEAAHKALGAGWVESPADVKAEVADPVEDVPEARVKPKKGK